MAKAGTTRPRAARGWAFTAGALALGLAMQSGAHGGGLNAEGCHNDRKNGGYHCHRAGASATRGPAAAIDRLAPARAGASARASGGGAYANCDAARAAGAAPVHRGDPGYGPHLDRDGDGVGCEPRRR